MDRRSQGLYQVLWVQKPPAAKKIWRNFNKNLLSFFITDDVLFHVYKDCQAAYKHSHKTDTYKVFHRYEWSNVS